MFWRSDKRLGKVTEARRYDLPLRGDESTRFLRTLISLKAFLLSVGVMMVLGLHVLSSAWSEGMEYQVTVEIPSLKADRSVRSGEEIAALKAQILEQLQGQAFVASVAPQEDADLQEKLEVWLGSSAELLDIPLPSLINVTLDKSYDGAFAALESALETVITEDAVHLRRYESWLADIMRFSRGLQSVTWLVMGMILFAVFVSISGAVKAQIDIYAKDVQLLHLIGARDAYISGQFMRHFTWMALGWSFVGVTLALALGWLFSALFPVGALAGGAFDNGFNGFSFLYFAMIPLVLSGFTLGATFMTVERVLKKMV